MIKKEKKTKADGTVKTFIRVVEGYRPGPGLPPKQRSIKSFGYLEDQSDPVSFMAEVEEFNAHFKDDVQLRLEVAQNALMYSANNRRLNYGYKFLEAAYDLLCIDAFIDKYSKTHKFKGDYSLLGIFKFLVLLRIMSPDSKRATAQLQNNFYGMNTNYALQDIYRSLDRYADFDVELQRHLNEKVKETIGRDLTHAFYDVTNYFFEIDFPDGDDDLRRKGVSKEHRVDPITGMGLFIDSNGLPVSMAMFPGNQSEVTTLRPIMKDVKDSYGLGRLIVVADKGLNSSKNFDEIINNGDGYVVSQILRGKKGQRYHERLFDETGYTWNKERTYKYQLFREAYESKDPDGKKVLRQRNVLIYWDKGDADMAMRKRMEKLLKAEKAAGNNAYTIKKGFEEYLKEDIINGETGEFIENVKKKRTVDIEKAKADAKFDGYFCIITSELDYGEHDIRRTYGGLWKIEQSFRILKSDLYARPVFVYTNEHIRAHFLICFVALLVIRIIQHQMGENALSAERIARALKAANCQILKGGIIHLDDVGGAIAFKKTIDKHGEQVDTLEYSDEDEIALDYKMIQETFGTDFYNIYPRQEVFNKFLKNIIVA
jgi:transposase